VSAVEAPAGHDVRLDLPAETRFLRLARLTASGLAGDLDFDLDEVEDLRVAVDEACAVLVEVAADGARLALTYQIRGQTVEVCGDVAADRAPELHPVAQSVLALLASEFAVDHADGRASFRFLARRGEAGA
jgi:serine/threonine-protein kinase RsbW